MITRDIKHRFVLWFEHYAGLTHVDVRVGPMGKAAAKWCGSFTMTDEQFDDFRAITEPVLLPGLEFMEKPNLRIGGADESLWIRARRADANGIDPEKVKEAREIGIKMGWLSELDGQ